MFNPYNVVLNKDVKPLYKKYKTVEHAHFTVNLGVHLISHCLPENCINTLKRLMRLSIL